MLAVQATQFPPLQTMLAPLPHIVPGAVFPVNVQTEDPELQTVVPVWQVFPFGVQTLWAVQGTQLPTLQTRLVPHTLPF